MNQQQLTTAIAYATDDAVNNETTDYRLHWDAYWDLENVYLEGLAWEDSTAIVTGLREFREYLRTQLDNGKPQTIVSM